MNFTKQTIAVLIFCVGAHINSLGQSSVFQLMETQNTEDEKKKEPVLATFESTRLALGHSVETSKKGNLDFRISHRFARLDNGFYDLFGLDDASIRIGFDYGITDQLMVGFGRSSQDKEYDFSAKYRILQQSTGEGGIPLSLALLGEGTIKTLKDTDGAFPPFEDMLGSAVQALVARKFSSRFSAQLMPVWVYTAKPFQATDPQSIYSVGVGGSLKVSKWMSVNVEYYPLFGDNRIEGTVAPFTVGVDLHTGGHVFQLFLSNSYGTNERQFITQTYDRWDKGELHIGFNILRVFSVGRKGN